MLIGDSIVRGLSVRDILGGGWTNLGVWLNVVLPFEALTLAVHFITRA